MPMTELVPPDLLPEWIPGEKTLDSSQLNWQDLTLKGYNYPRQEVEIPQMRDYMIVVYEGDRAIMRRSGCGPSSSEPVERGVISLLTRAEQSVWAWDGPIRVKHIYLGHEAISETASRVFERDLDRIEIGDRVRAEDLVIPRLLEMLEVELGGEGFGERLLVDCIRTQLAVHVLRHYADVVFRDERVGVLGGQLRRRLIDYVENNLSEVISLDGLASICGLSPFHFARKFKAEFGVPPHHFVMQRRVARARALLQRSRLPLKVVAAECGFSDQSHLSRSFRRHFGVTPGSLRGGSGRQ